MVSAEGPRPHLVLIGAMGAGKTTVGRLVAERRHVPFFDNDELLEARTGRPARRIEAEDGLDALHRLEGEVLLRALADERPSVVAAAASTVERAAVRQALRRRAVTVWLDTDTARLDQRVAGTGRPRAGMPSGKLVAGRRDLYLSVADATVNTGHAGPEESAEQILAATTRWST